MDFNSPIFLFIFLPLFLLAYILIKDQTKKWLLLIPSALAYIWFQRENATIILSIILINFFFLKLLERNFHQPLKKALFFWLALIINLSAFLIFKTFTTPNWLQDLVIGGVPTLAPLNTLSFPLGLSFILFHILSVLMDFARAPKIHPVRFSHYLTYLLMFPKLVMGPITRFSKIEPQLDTLTTDSQTLVQGAKRFIIGLAKKVLIADQLAVYTTAGFNLPTPGYPTSIAWLLIIAFTIQIYYDFSGVIDMAIGISKMLGISLPENFNSPYSALCITDFWRRWHMTLIAWFREYVFYPLEFKFRRFKRFRQDINILIVFLLTGLWHGINFTFIAWGMLQGILIIFEKSKLGSWLRKAPTFLQRIYFFLALIISWVLFQSHSIAFALRFIKRLFLINQDASLWVYPFLSTNPLPIINNSFILLLLIGILCLFPLKKQWGKIAQSILQKVPKLTPFLNTALDFLYLLLLAVSILVLASQNFVPAIYATF